MRAQKWNSYLFFCLIQFWTLEKLFGWQVKQLSTSTKVQLPPAQAPVIKFSRSENALDLVAKESLHTQPQIATSTLPSLRVSSCCKRRAGEHQTWKQRVTFSFVLETDALSFQHTAHWRDTESTLSVPRNMSLGTWRDQTETYLWYCPCRHAMLSCSRVPVHKCQ